MADRYPPVEPFEFGWLEVGNGHSIYWESVGSVGATPAVYLHGGPGGGARPGARRHFDPAGYRAVLFDQRGCGRSRPLADGPDADLATNTTAYLIADLEALRDHLRIERWVVLGVPWGVTLALAYAQAHPDRVIALVLAAVTSGTRREIDWITRDVGRIFPAAWDDFAAGVPAAERDGDLAAAYARLLADPDEDVRSRAVRAWCTWEDVHISLTPGWQPDSRLADPVRASVFARLVTHYWSHNCFLVDGHIMAGMARLEGIAGVLIHGQYDVSGPSETAWRLHRAWPGSRLVLLDDAGHGGGSFAGEITAALDEVKVLD